MLKYIRIVMGILAYSLGLSLLVTDIDWRGTIAILDWYVMIASIISLIFGIYLLDEEDND